MKKKYFFLVTTFLLLQYLQLMGQQTLSHQNQSPPVNPGYAFTRGMNVDCADKILIDISNGNNLKFLQLNEYIRKNFIKYIVLSGLEHSNIFGNPTMESVLKSFIYKVRITFPGIQIGISGSDSGYFQATGPVSVPTQFAANCFPKGTLNNYNNLNQALNDAGPFLINLKKSELCKFFYRASQFGINAEASKNISACKTSFDAFYIEYRYWNRTTSLAAMQNEFSNYKTILSVLQILKCSYGCVRNIDSEFLPTEIFNLQGWTAIDQITDADPLADRLIIPSFTSNAGGTYDQVCKTLHFLSDRFSKPNSKIFIELNAESSSFNYCNSSQIPNNYLGDFLNGTVTPSGNMYSAEKMFLNKFNNIDYMCSLCSCRPYNDNHYNYSNTYGNSLVGVIWTPYTMLNDHSLFREQEKPTLEIVESKPILFQIIDINGRIKNYKSQEEIFSSTTNNSITEGIYFIKIVYDDGKQDIRKIFINSR